MAASSIQTPEKGGCCGNTRKTGFQPMGDTILSFVQCGWCVLGQIREEWGNKGMPRFSFRNIGRDKLGSTSSPATRLERFHLSSKTLTFKSLMT